MIARTRKQLMLKPKHARTDRRTRDLVDQAIAALPDLGLRASAAFLASQGVPHEVALRALVYPERRRAIAPPSYGPQKPAARPVAMPVARPATAQRPAA